MEIGIESIEKEECGILGEKDNSVGKWEESSIDRGKRVT